ncbi:melanocyte-stimulating hormone receptor-like [Actinia tenebrosa]|uniref:Melanocyte-stimulating hormone receptor-like n=1 Tax=Actinia tenebrosa TaxID=6105 RepID=A0A6P8IMJ0_ACTTE|nr:melanocyte-stimulating hormone receptor-like [Actinia tenebrosa]
MHLLTAILKTPTLHTPSNVLLCFLAFSDFGVGFVVQPLSIAATIVSNAHGHQQLLKTCTESASVLLYGASMLTMTAIAVDRYLALLLHLRYRTIVTVPRTLKLKTLLWFIALCIYFFRYLVDKKARYISIITFILVLLFTSSYCYIQILRIVQRHRRQILDQTLSITRQFSSSCVPTVGQGKSITTMYYIHGLFVVCVIPYIVGIFLLLKFGQSRSVTIYRYAAWTALTLNSVLNPFLYCWRIQGIKIAIKTLLKSFIDKSRLNRVGIV